jgi:hypothetical protein
VSAVETPLRERLVPRVELTFPGFARHDDPDWPVRAYAFEQVHCHDWYRSFAARVCDAVGTGRHLPVYRISDGEFRFMVGPPTVRRPWWQWSPRLIAMRGNEILHGARRAHRSGAQVYGYEFYTSEEWQHLRGQYVDQLRRIADEGILAVVLHETGIVQAYVPEVLDWFDANAVEIHGANYHHMYSVYVLFHGPDRQRLLRHRDVLVVTSLTEAKRSAIERGLKAADVNSIQFLGISGEKSMLDRLDLTQVRRPVDLILVGAGVGSANCLDQLRPLGAVAIDAGFCLSTLGDPDLRFDRPYCVPDEDFDPVRMRFEWQAGPVRRVRARLARASR